MTGQIIALIREAKDRPDGSGPGRQDHVPVSPVDARCGTSTASRLDDDEGLMGVVSRLAWQSDLDVSQSLTPVTIALTLTDCQSHWRRSCDV